MEPANKAIEACFGFGKKSSGCHPFKLDSLPLTTSWIHVAFFCSSAVGRPFFLCLVSIKPGKLARVPASVKLGCLAYLFPWYSSSSSRCISLSIAAWLLFLSPFVNGCSFLVSHTGYVQGFFFIHYHLFFGTIVYHLLLESDKFQWICKRSRVLYLVLVFVFVLVLVGPGYISLFIFIHLQLKGLGIVVLS